MLLLVVFSLLGCGGDTKEQPQDDRQVLNLYSWADHFDPVLVEEFEQKYNCRVNYDTFGNNEELFAKIQAGGAQYDLILPSDYMVATMLKLDMLEEFNLDNIPNAKTLLPTYVIPAMTLQASIAWSTPGVLRVLFIILNILRKNPSIGLTFGTKNMRVASY